MRLDRVFFDGFKNLKGVEADFDQSRLTTVVIGQNGAGKSNLIEAITDIFRFVDMNRGAPRYLYEIDYRIGNHTVRLSNRDGRPTISADGKLLTRAAFERDRRDLFPDLVFGYYSGGSRRLEKLFDSHQRRYYDAIKINEDPKSCRKALTERQAILLSADTWCICTARVLRLSRRAWRALREKLGVTGFDSALAHFREPWFAKGGRTSKLGDAADFWGAKGPAGTCARAIRNVAFHPLALEGNAIDDYRDKQDMEAEYACFLRNEAALKRYAETMPMIGRCSQRSKRPISPTSSAIYMSGSPERTMERRREFRRSFRWERQLLMVLGLIRVSRGKRALFLLDEPDTHLNPMWQHSYLDLIREWTGLAADADKCHIVLTSHNPLTIAALEREDVRVMFTEEAGKVSVTAPYTDPKGMGFTATFTEIFGLPTSLDSDTQRQVDDRNALARIDHRTEEQEKQLIEINDKLNRLGFMFEDREPLYQDFLRAWQDVRYADRPPLSPVQIEKRHAAMKELIKNLLAKKETAS